MVLGGIGKAMGHITDSMNWARMGKNEAMARVMQREINKAPKDHMKSSMFEDLNTFHQGEHGSGFLEGDSKTAIKASFLNLMNAQHANSVAAGAWLNPKIMEVADAWQLDKSTIDNSMAGYQSAVNSAGKSLINTLISATQGSWGSLSEGAGGFLTQQETALLLEGIGTWNDQARQALEAGHERGKLMNALAIKYGGKDVFTVGHPDFAKPKDESGQTNIMKNFSEHEMNDIMNIMKAAGQEGLAELFTAHAANDLQYKSTSQQQWQKEIDFCTDQHGGKGPIYLGEDLASKEGSKVTYNKETAKGVDPSSNTISTGDPFEKSTWKEDHTYMADYDSDVRTRCASKIASNMAAEGYPQGDLQVLHSMGIGSPHIKRQLKGSQANRILWGGLGDHEEEGYISWVKQEAKNIGTNLTGLRIKYLRQDEFAPSDLDFRTLTHLDLDNRAHRGLIALELAAAARAGKAPVWLQGREFTDAQWKGRRGGSPAGIFDYLKHFREAEEGQYTKRVGGGHAKSYIDNVWSGKSLDERTWDLINHMYAPYSTVYENADFDMERKFEEAGSLAEDMLGEYYNNSLWNYRDTMLDYEFFLGDRQ